MRLRKEDIELADRIIADLLNAGMLDQSKMQSFRYRRIIATLQERAYIKDEQTHILPGSRAELYFEDGGARAIYEEQQFEEDRLKYQKRELRWANLRSWAAIIISLITLIWQIVATFIAS